MESYRCNLRKFLFITFLLSSISIIGTQKWCWTTSMVNEPSFVLDKTKGGMNWGYCQTKKMIPPTKYFAVVKTSPIKGSGTKSNLLIKMYGTKGVTEPLPFYKFGFDKGSTKKISFPGKNIAGKQNYRCKEITIFAMKKKFKFSCLRALSVCTANEPTKCFLDIEVDGPINYKVEVKMGNKKDDGTKSPVFLTIIGQKGAAQKKLISDGGIKPSENKVVSVDSNDVGKIVGFTIDMEDNGKMRPVEVSITNNKNGDHETFKLDSVVVVRPGKCPYTFNKSAGAGKSAGNGGVGASSAVAAAIALATGQTPPQPPAPAGAISGGPGGAGFKFDNPGAAPGGSMDINNPDGGLVSPAEKGSIIELTCLQTLENPDEQTNLFGPEYPTKNVNYLRVLARCPGDCYKNKDVKVYGVGIHPHTSPICMSAIVDNAMSLFGGIISISVFPAYEKYEIEKDIPAKKHNIKILPYDKKDAKKSYVLAKVDNVDLVEKDIRIVNEKGQLTASGRVEMRYQGIWGTLCMKGTNRKAAKVICREIGYKDGEWKNPEKEAGKDFCKSFNGEDHCGSETSVLFLANIKCHKEDDKFKKCEKTLTDPNVCGHEFDAIINCFNNDYTKVPPVPAKTIRLENYKTYGDKITGRLEMYYKNKWNPVCNVGFNKHSAMVACKTMHYESGKFIINKTLKKFQLPKTDPRPFTANMLVCKGDEKSIQKCSMNMNNVKCKHEQDVVLICLGKAGDPSGRSQYIKKIPQPPPKLGKLPTASRKIDCKIKGDNLLFRGDPGSVYLVTCPGFCDSQPGSVWGIGVYSSDSHVCKAAIHSGVIGVTGGLFAYVKTYNQKSYQGDEHADVITDDSHKVWNQSFSISMVNTGWINSGGALSFLQRYEAKIKLIDRIHSPIVLKHHIEKNEGYNNHYVNKLMQYTSFLQIENRVGEQIPILDYVRPSYLFKFKPDTQMHIEKHLIQRAVGDWTLITQFKMLEFKDENTFIFSYGGCGNFNLFITKTGSLIIGDYCQPSKYWNTGLRIPINDLVTIYLRYTDSTLSIISTSEKGKIPFIKKFPSTMILQYLIRNNIWIGRSADSDKNHFIGEIKFLQIYQGDFPKGNVNALISAITIRGLGDTNNFQKTVDERPCVSSCNDNPVPPSPLAGPAPPGANINGPMPEEKKSSPSGPSGSESNDPNSKPPGTGPNGTTPGQAPAPAGGSPGGKNADPKKASKKLCHNEADKNNGQIEPGATGTYNHAHKNNIETLDIKCETNLKDKRFEGSPGKIFRVRCPDCNGDKSMVFGTAIYHPLSSICRAGLHIGAIKAGAKKGGEIHVLLTGKKLMFNGSDGQAKITSGTFSADEKSFSISEAKPLTKVECKSTANQGKFAGAIVNTKFVVVCPPKCSKDPDYKLFGNEYYSDNSSICFAGIHHGVINDLGGEVKFKITAGQRSYKGTNGFGILSKDMGPHIRSFQLVGTKAAIHYHYTEQCDGSLKHKWEHLQTENGSVKNKVNDTWKFENSLDGGKGLEKFTGISHEGNIAVPGFKNTFSSWIYLKNAEWANGTVKFNLFLKDKKPVAFFFRYKDQKNYYAIQFDPTKSLYNISLLKIIEGFASVVETKSKEIDVETHYRVEVEYNYEDLRVLIQTQKIREKKVIFNRKIQGLHRGTIGFGTNGNKKFYIGGIKIFRTNISLKGHNPANTYTFQHILQHSTAGEIATYCSDLFIADKMEINRCKRPHLYCKYRCDDSTNKIENIRNFSCFTQCLNQLKILPKIVKPREAVNWSWIPKLGDKCDLKPSGAAVYYAGNVKKLKYMPKEKKSFATVEYTTSHGEKRQVTIMYPSSSFLPCGKGIFSRTDCKK